MSLDTRPKGIRKEDVISLLHEHKVQAEVARRMGVSKALVSRIASEYGLSPKPRPITLSKKVHPLVLGLGLHQLSSARLREVAERSGVQYSTMWAWLTGENVHPSLSSLEAVAGARGLRLALIEEKQS